MKQSKKTKGHFASATISDLASENAACFLFAPNYEAEEIF
jgi:hypothetical protein